MIRARLRYNVGVEFVLALGLGIGLASVAGVRAFLPFVLALTVALFGYFEPSASYSDAAGGWVGFRGIAPFAVLAILEIVLDKVKRVERFFNTGMVPVRAVAGGLLAGAVAPEAEFVVWLVGGAVISGAVAVLKVLLRPSASVASSGVSTSFLSLIEDVIGLVGGVISFFVPFLPALLVAFLLFFYARIRKRRGRKFGGLRILGD